MARVNLVRLQRPTERLANQPAVVAIEVARLGKLRQVSFHRVGKIRPGQKVEAAPGKA